MRVVVVVVMHVKTDSRSVVRATQNMQRSVF